jgi:hypothetical protein
MSQLDEFHELSFYTLAHPDRIYFIHQHIVDAFQAQTADQNTKPIAIVFSLVGLYLFLEHGYTGRQVQLAHMTMARNKKTWPLLELPAQRGLITVTDILRAEPGEQRDKLIKDWCDCVWDVYRGWHGMIATLSNVELELTQKGDKG